MPAWLLVVAKWLIGVLISIEEPKLIAWIRSLFISAEEKKNIDAALVAHQEAVVVGDPDKIAKTGEDVLNGKAPAP